MPARRCPPTTPARDGYHHGALREALIEASESLLAERGLEGFSLREVARRSGVSPAAPAHHFGSAAGLLTAVATLAFDGLTAALEAGNARGGTDPVARLREQGVGYVTFALRHPGRYGLMFRAGVERDAPLERSAEAAFAVLETGVRALFAVPASARATPLEPARWQVLLSIWSVVHGFADLALSGHFDRIAPARSRAALLRETVAPMLEQLLVALRDRVGGESGGNSAGKSGGKSGGRTGGKTGGKSGGKTGGKTGGASGGASACKGARAARAIG